MRYRLDCKLQFSLPGHHKAPDHSFNPYATYSYSLYPTQEAFRRALEDLYRKEVLPARDNGLCAAIYTQLSDVEDEVNGLLTYDRALCKADEARMREIAELLQFQTQRCQTHTLL